MQKEKTHIFGKHPIYEALRERPDVVFCVYAEDGNYPEDIRELAKHTGVRLATFTEKDLPGGVPKDAVHQGLIAEINADALVQKFDRFINSLSITNDTGLVILGEVNDPHNVGAVIRSAAAFGAAGVLIPEHRQVQVNGTIVKTSAGMAFKIPLVSIGNVNQTIKELKDKGFWVYGLDGDAEMSLGEEGFEKPSVLVLGNEASGIREKTREHCDILLRIPMKEGVESLNASVAAGVVLYAWKQRHI